MNPDQLEKLLRDIKESVEWGITASKKSESDLFGSFQQDLKLLKQDIKGVHERLDVLNGRIPKIETRLSDGEFNHKLLQTSALVVVKTAGVFITIVLALSVFIFMSLSKKVDHISNYLEDRGETIFNAQQT